MDGWREGWMEGGRDGGTDGRDGGMGGLSIGCRRNAQRELLIQLRNGSAAASRPSCGTQKLSRGMRRAA